jgi:hypothetical protein
MPNGHFDAAISMPGQSLSQQFKKELNKLLSRIEPAYLPSQQERAAAAG